MTGNKPARPHRVGVFRPRDRLAHRSATEDRQGLHGRMPLSAGTHTFVLEVPDAEFADDQGNFAVSLYLHAL